MVQLAGWLAGWLVSWLAGWLAGSLATRWLAGSPRAKRRAIATSRMSRASARARERAIARSLGLAGSTRLFLKKEMALRY